jgi:hypothetical protein
VCDAGLVRVREPGANVFDKLQLPRQWKWLATADQIGKRLARHMLHRNEGTALVFADVVDGDDIGMGQAAGRLGFMRKTLAEILIVVSLA